MGVIRFGLSTALVRVLVCGVLVLAATTAVASDDLVTVEVETDTAVSVFIDGKLEGLMSEMAIEEFEVSAEVRHVVWVMATNAPGLGQRFVVDISYGSELLEVELGDEVEEWLESDPEDRQSAPWPGTLVDRLNGTLHDTETDLVWMRRDNGQDLDWEQAQEFCSTVEMMAGREWRLPTLEELESLVTEDFDEMDTEYRSVPPIHLTGCCAWSSEEYGNISAWYMGFDAGERGFVTRDYAEGGRALCVREADSGEEEE